MIQQITLTKKISIDNESKDKQYVQSLDTLVNDLSSTKLNGFFGFFSPNIKLKNADDDYHYEYYDVDYGVDVKRDKTGVPKEHEVKEYTAKIKTLNQLRSHIKKALKLSHPKFEIDYVEMICTSLFLNPEFESNFEYGQIESIKIHEKDSSTKIQADISGTVTGPLELKITFNYDDQSYAKEIKRIENSVAELLKRGYQKNPNP